MFSLKEYLDTQNDIFGNIIGGAAQLLEGVVDFGAGVAGQFGADTEGFIKRNYTQEYLLDPVAQGTQKSAINKLSPIGQTITRGVAQGVGQMLPVTAIGLGTKALGIGTKVAQGISLGTLGVGAAGGGVQSALLEGATKEQAMLYGTAVGALETGIEMLSGGVWDNVLGKGVADKVISKVVRSSNPVIRKGLKLVFDAGGEGVEEMISEIVEPYVRRAIYDKEATPATVEQVLESGLIGALTAVTYQGSIGNVIKRKSGAYVSETIEDIKALDSKENTLWANNKLTDTEMQKIDKQRAYLTSDLNKAYNRLSAKKQASIGEMVSPYLTSDKVNSNYVSRGVRASQVEGITLATELTEQENIEFNKLKQQHEKLRKIGLTANELVLADIVDKNVRGMQKSNLIVIAKEELNRKVNILGQEVSTATQTLIHELTHFSEGSKEYQEFATLAYETSIKSGDNSVSMLIKEGMETKDKAKVEEGVAIFSELIFNENSIDRIARANRSFGYKILDRITEIIKKLKGEPTITPVLRKAEKLWLKALEKGEGQANTRLSGYSGYSMSNNAVDAYNNGEMPISKWTKDIFLKQCEDEGINIDKITEYKKYLKKSSWHHTSKFYNATDFYSIDFELVKEDIKKGEIKGSVKEIEVTDEIKKQGPDILKDWEEEIEKEKEEFLKSLEKVVPVSKTIAGHKVLIFYVPNPDALNEKDYNLIREKFNIPNDTDIILSANGNIKYSKHSGRYYRSDIRLDEAETLAEKLVAKTKRGLYSRAEIASVFAGMDMVIPGKGNILQNLKASFDRKPRAEVLEDIELAIQSVIDKGLVIDTQRVDIVASATKLIETLKFNSFDLTNSSIKNKYTLARWGGGTEITTDENIRNYEAIYHSAMREIRQGLRVGLEGQDTAELEDKIRKGLLDIYDNKKPTEQIIDFIADFQDEIYRLSFLVNDAKYYNKEYNKALRGLEHLKRISTQKFGKELGMMHEWVKDIASLKFRDAIRDKSIREKVIAFKEIYESEFFQDYRTPEMLEAIDYIVANDSKITGRQMEALRKVIDGVNNLFKTYKKAYITVGAEQVLSDMEPILARGIPEIKNVKGITKLERYMLDPEAVARKLDNYESGLNQLWLKELQQGELRAKVELMKIEKELQKWKKEHKNYKLDREIEVNGHKVNIEIAISLYLTSLREHAKLGLEKAGWVYFKQGKAIEIAPQKVLDMQDELVKQFTDTDIELITLVNTLLDKAKELKVETDMQRLGFTNATEDYYFPISRYSAVSSVETEYGQSSVNTASFNKDTIENKNKLKISSVLSVLEKHVKGVCMYYGLGATVDTFNRTYNTTYNGTNARQELAKVWIGADAYYKQLLADTQGLNSTKDGFNIAIGFMRGSFATYQLGLNPKVLLTQVSAVVSGAQKLGVGNIVKGIGRKISFSDLDKYCKFAELRHFEHGAFRALSVLQQGEVKGKGTQVVEKVRKFGESLMVGIQAMDRLSIGILWNAAQQQAKGEGFKLGTVENKERAGEILEETIRETQANYTPTERSAAMRSKHETIKTFTMFTADANKLVSRFADSIGEIYALRKKLKADPQNAELKKRIKAANAKLAKSTSAIIVVNSYLAALTMLFNKFYKREEKDEIPFIKEFAGNILGMLPFFKDTASYLLEGYEVKSSMFGAVNDILGSVKKGYELTERAIGGELIQQEEIGKATRDTLYAIGLLFGVPIRNFNNLIYGTTNLVSPEGAYKYNSLFYKPYISDLDKAIKEGDYGLAETTLTILMNRAKMQGDSERLVKLYEQGYKVLPRMVSDTISIDGVEYTLTKSQQETFFEIYSKANTNKMLDSNLTDEYKAYAIRQAYSFYWDSAVEETLGIATKKSTIAKSVDANELSLALAYHESLVGDNKKERTIRYLRSKFNRREVNLILAYLGYSQ